MQLKFNNRINHTINYFSSTNLLWEVELTNVNLDSIYPELLRSDIWQTENAHGNLRFKNNDKSEIINNFLNEFNSLKTEILEYIYHYDRKTFAERWWKSLEYYENNSSMYSRIFKDTPGFNMGPHLDNSHIIAQLVLNITNNTTGTEFYETSKTKPYYKAPLDQYKGVLFFNNATAGHGIQNVTEDRFILYSSILY
jgi:hypothetical protein